MFEVGKMRALPRESQNMTCKMLGWPATTRRKPFAAKEMQLPFLVEITSECLIMLVTTFCVSATSAPSRRQLLLVSTKAMKPSLAEVLQTAVAGVSGVDVGHTDTTACRRTASLRAVTTVIRSSLAAPVSRPLRMKSRKEGTAMARITAATASVTNNSMTVKPRLRLFMGRDAERPLDGRVGA